jgi:hypothetical protein
VRMEGRCLVNGDLRHVHGETLSEGKVGSGSLQRSVPRKDGRSLISFSSFSPRCGGKGWKQGLFSLNEWDFI